MSIAGEQHIAGAGAESWSDLRDADRVLGEIAEHLVRLSGNRVAVHAARTAEEQQRSALLLRRHRRRVAACELIERRVREDESELELGDCFPEHEEVDRRALLDLGEYVPKQCAICRRGV